MRLANVTGAAVFLAIAAPGQAAAQMVLGVRDSFAARADSVFRSFDRTDSPGCALGVYRNGRILYARGYGMANLELGVPITPRTVFDVGSVSKQFTVLSIFLLQQDGRIRMDDDVRRHLPELPAYASNVTFRQALNHTAGLRDYLTLMGLASDRASTYEGAADSVDYLRVITRSETTNFDVRSRYLYSNTGYVMAATALYRITGRTLARFAGERIFEPLGMRDTRFHEDRGAIYPGRATGYAPAGAGRFRILMSQFDQFAGPGGLHTTVEDLAHWERNFTDATVGGRAVLDEMQTRSRLSNDSAIAYGLGLTMSRYRGLPTVEHGGSWAGYRAHWLRFPEQGLTVACLCNVTNAGPDTLARKVGAVYLGAQMGPDTIAEWVRSLASAPAATVAEDALRARAGVWRNELLGETRRTRMANGRLVIGFQQRSALTPLDANRYRVTVAGEPTEVTFSADSAGAPSRMVLRNRGGSVTWTRVPLASLSDAQLAEYAGVYHSPELDVVYVMAPDSGRLAISVNGRRRSTLEPTFRDAFSDGNINVEFQRDRRGRITGYLVQSGRVRNLRVVRR